MPHPPVKTSSRKVLKLQRQEQAIAMRLEHKTLEEIGNFLGISKQSVHALITEAMADLRERITNSADQLVNEEAMRLERVQQLFHNRMASVDIDEAAKAAAVYLKASEGKRKLLGLDAPSKNELSGADGKPLQLGVFAIPAPVQSVEEWATSAKLLSPPSQTSDPATSQT